MHSIVIENNKYYTCLKKKDYYSLLTLLHSFQLIVLVTGKLTFHCSMVIYLG
jgi:hypothetical protein